MMYRMNNIITYDDDIILPKCMYNVKRIVNFNDTETNFDVDLKINDQISDSDMAELVDRQDRLLKKLQVLHDKIMEISSNCTSVNVQKRCTYSEITMVAPAEIVVTVHPDYLPLYMGLLFNGASSVNVVWHIHSSVPKEKINKIKAFVNSFNNVANGHKSKLRLIFSAESADTELKSSLQIPIVGDVNVLRYLSLLHPNIFPSSEDYTLDSLLDLCYLLKKSTERSKESISKKLFSQCNGWIYNKQFTIVDIAAYNVIKQWINCPKYIPSDWFKKCEQYFK